MVAYCTSRISVDNFHNQANSFASLLQSAAKPIETPEEKSARRTAHDRKDDLHCHNRLQVRLHFRGNGGQDQ